MNIFYLNLILTFHLLFIVTNTIFPQVLTPETIYEEVNKSVVVVLVGDEKGATFAQGSGVVINEEVVIVTNYHVFAEGKKITIKKGHKLIDDCIIVGSDISKDILLIKIAGSNSFPKIKIGNSDYIKVGQRVYAIGTPLGEENSMSEGIISGIREKDNNRYIQITASISPGSSGGAVVNEYGELIGISSMTLIEGQNINYAIPVNEILKVNIKKQDEITIEANEYLNKARIAEKKADFKLAIYYYTKFLQLKPDSAKIYFDRAFAYWNLSLWEKSLADYSSYIKLEPNDDEGYASRGHLYKQLGKSNLAYADFSKAIELNPDNGRAYIGLGDINYDMGNYEKALEYYEIAKKKNGIWGLLLRDKIAELKEMLGK